MDIQLEKIELIKLLQETENPSIIQSIKKIFQKEKRDWWLDLTDEQKNILNNSLKEADRGEVRDFKELISSYL